MRNKKAKMIRNSVKNWNDVNYNDRKPVQISRWRTVSPDEPIYKDITEKGAMARMKVNYQSQSPITLGTCGRRDYKLAKRFFT